MIWLSASYRQDTSPVYTTTFLARYPFEFGPGPLNFQPGTLHFCRVNGKIRGTSAPKQTSAETMYIGSLGPRMFWGARATNFSIYTTKMEGAGPKILDTRAKFKRVPCQKNCRVNRASLLVQVKTFEHSSPVYTTIFLARYLFEFGPGARGGRDYLSTWSRHSSVLGYSCHEFFHLHDKNEGCRAANYRHRGQI